MADAQSIQPLTRGDSAPPAINNVPVRRSRRSNAEMRPREYLTAPEIERLMAAARKRRYGTRDALMILLAYRHALRVSELIGLRWSDVDFTGSRIHVKRLKGSISGIHPLEGDELRGLRKVRNDGEFIFMSERKAPFTASGFRKMLSRIAVSAGMSALAVHPHALRHSCGYYLVNRGVDLRTIQGYLGHSNISNTVRYTALDANRFKGLWRK